MVIIGRKLKMDFMLKTFMLVGVLVTVTNCTLHTIGFRTAGDRLVINDTLRTTPTPMARNHTLEFNYPIKNAITCIEFYVDSDVHAEYSLSVNKVLRGIITAIDVTDFELHILVFGIEFNATTDSFHALLNSVAQMTGTIYPDEEYDEYDYDDDVTGEFIPNGILTYGERQPGDQLLINETLKTAKTRKPKNHIIEFNYPVKYGITCIELYTHNNILAEYSFNVDKILRGTITAIGTNEFELNVLVYGIEYNATTRKFPPLLNSVSQLTGSIFAGDDDYYKDIEDLIEEDDPRHGIIMLGLRQTGDKLIFKTFESTPATLEFARHSLIFRYIDSHYLTCAKYIALKNREPGAIFSHISDHSIKAEVYTLNAHTLDVEFLLYGYEPGEKPKDYKHFLNANITGSSGGLNGGGAAVPIAGWAPAGFMLYITISIWLCLF